ncbi:unnamed protein product [Rotaria sordida]|uniref:Uncharacterized protein n=1 Tax=Rotaria sordida TaxID=392033 RepID=A0A814LUK1_9BILA|nr:unnamed protein product [Rotaria sordida]
MVSFSKQGFRQKYEAIIEDMETDACIGGQTSDSLAFQEYSAVMQDETKQYCRRSIIREFCLNISTHALPGIARSENKINRNESLKPLFYPLSSMLSTCSFNVVPCLETDFLPFISSTSGLCYTFNAKLKYSNNDSIRYGNKNGGDGNLKLGLYVHNHQYVPYVRDNVGIVSLVHDNTQLPLIEAAAPYTTCTNKIPLLMHVMFNNYHGANYGYSETVCYQICGQVYAHKQCGCVNPNLRSTRSVILSGTDKIILVSLCNASNTYYTEAVDTLLASSILMNKYCSDCSQQCLITNFIIQTSSLTTPVG